MRKHCSYCGLETWACGCGGHCYNPEEHALWRELYGLDCVEIAKIRRIILEREEKIKNGI